MPKNEVNEAIVCPTCGKAVGAEGIGSTCASHFRSLLGTKVKPGEQLTPEQVTAYHEAMKNAKVIAADIPEGYVNVGVWWKHMKAKAAEAGGTMPNSLLHKAIGGEPAIGTPLRSEYKVTYVGRKKYISGECVGAKLTKWLLDQRTDAQKARKA